LYIIISPPVAPAVLVIMPEMFLEGIIFTVRDEVFKHPFPSSPVTSYEVESVGVTLIEFVVAPEFHVYETAPEAFKSDEDPLQILVLPFIEMLGNALTLIF
jgi:hypothetical protein